MPIRRQPPLLHTVPAIRRLASTASRLIISPVPGLYMRAVSAHRWAAHWLGIHDREPLSRSNDPLRTNGTANEVLFDLVQKRPGITVQEMSTKTGFAPPTVAKVMSKLLAAGTVSRKEEIITRYPYKTHFRYFPVEENPDALRID